MYKPGDLVYFPHPEKRLELVEGRVAGHKVDGILGSEMLWVYEVDQDRNILPWNIHLVRKRDVEEIKK